MPIYEKWVNNNTERLNLEDTSDALKIDKLVAKGYLLVVEPPTLDPAINKKGAYSFTATERSWEVVALSQEELDALAAEAAEQEERAADAIQLLYELSESELQWWINTDKVARDAAINAATIDPGLRSLHKKEADAIAAIASVLNLLRKGGLFDFYLPSS